MTAIIGVVMLLHGGTADRGQTIAGAILLGCYVIADAIDDFRKARSK